ncbi:Maf family protein [uncultured Acetatifactor sp.]|uniref:Maf family protein n=1 Tax=uncultured Acetatifactor sp. TaxID=1671927 RepID=UPI002609D432|nr:Maf family protein [uncultured Acetatifactor sp.]
MKIVLASASPRRRELLEQIGLPFEVRVSDVEEKAAVLDPGQLVEELSRQKAEAVLAALEEAAEDTIVIGADTVVAMEGHILGKPADSEDAAGMLEGLSGKSHEVYTGVTLLYRPAAGESGGSEICRKTFYERTKVSFYSLTKKEISDYVSSGECLDKAGAYGIQGVFARYVRGIEGDYNNVVGLPVGRLYQEAKEWIT